MIMAIVIVIVWGWSLYVAYQHGIASGIRKATSMLK